MAYEASASSSSRAKTNHRPAAAPSLEMKKRKSGRKKFHETRHPIYKGVRQRNGKWVCELRESKKSTVWVGTFSCPETAARAHDAAAVALKGESAALNFPDLAYSLPRVAPSSSVSLIRRAAVEVGEAFNTSPFAEVWNGLFVDEEEVFNMPGIIAGMAEGLILTPPAMERGFSWEEYDHTTELSLWSDD